MTLLLWIAVVDLALLAVFLVTCWAIGWRAERREERMGWTTRHGAGKETS